MKNPRYIYEVLYIGQDSIPNTAHGDECQLVHGRVTVTKGDCHIPGDYSTEVEFEEADLISITRKHI